MLTDKNPVFALRTYKLVFIKKECMDLMDRILCKSLKPTLISSYFAYFRLTSYFFKVVLSKSAPDFLKIIYIVSLDISFFFHSFSVQSVYLTMFVGVLVFVCLLIIKT